MQCNNGCQIPLAGALYCHHCHQREVEEARREGYNQAVLCVMAERDYHQGQMNARMDKMLDATMEYERTDILNRVLHALKADSGVAIEEA